MMKKSFKNRSAVSPVIATILMVAITVVLAAVLYVMVMGFGGGTPQAPAATMTNDSANDRVIVNINPATSFSNMKFSYDGTVLSVANGASITGANTSLTLTFVDVGGDGKVTSGDYFTITGTKAAAGTLALLWVSGDTTQSIVSITV